MDNSKKNLMKELKKRLNASLEHHLTGPHAILHEVSAFINIYIYIYIDDTRKNYNSMLVHDGSS